MSVLEVRVVIGEGHVSVVDTYLDELQVIEQPYIVSEIQDIDLKHRQFKTKAELEAYGEGYVDAVPYDQYTFLIGADARAILREMERRRATVEVDRGYVEIDYDTGVVLWPNVTDESEDDVWTIKSYDVAAYVRSGNRTRKDRYCRNELTAIREA